MPNGDQAKTLTWRVIWKAIGEHLSDMRLSALASDVTQLLSVTEIALPQTFLCVQWTEAPSSTISMVVQTLCCIVRTKNFTPLLVTYTELLWLG